MSCVYTATIMNKHCHAIFILQVTFTWNTSSIIVSSPHVYQLNCRNYKQVDTYFCREEHVLTTICTSSKYLQTGHCSNCAC